MWSRKYLSRIDFRFIFIISFLMIISLLVLSSMSSCEGVKENFFTFVVKKQIKSFFVGWVVFFFCAGLDYQKLREWTWILYLIMILLLLGLYFLDPIHRVHRWYKIPFLNIYMQPSEYTKLILVICLGWILEKNEKESFSFKSFLQIFLTVAVPFFLILKQPDLGTALVIYPLFLIMCYFGGVNKKILKFFFYCGLVVLIFANLLFFKILPFERLKSVFSPFVKEYQIERLNPNSYHHKASQIAIAIGGITGKGWKKSEFAKRKWLPAAYTDSVFASFAEEFGLIGLFLLIFLFYLLIYLSFQIINLAKDYFGRLLASGIAVYLSMHIIVNIAMMCGYLPISGVPLLLITYGGSSTVTTMAAFGILQSIYTRRFIF